MDSAICGSARGGFRRRRGVALYATTLLISILVSGAGLGLVLLQMTHRRLQRNIRLSQQASLAAGAGMDWAFLNFGDPNWRSTAVPGYTYDLGYLGLGGLTMVVADPDNSFTDDDTEGATVTITSTVTSGAGAAATSSSHRLRFSAVPKPSAALGYTIFSRDSVAFSGSVAISSPIRAQTTITDDLSAVVSSGAAFETVSGYVISPNLTPVKYASSSMTAPTPDLTFYTNQATAVPSSGTTRFELTKVNLTPTANSVGTTNAKGIYWINAGGKEVRLRYVHVKGTLVVTNTANNKVYCDDACWFEPGGFGYPVVLVDAGTGAFQIAFPSGDTLSESSASVDFNQDGDKSDSFQPSITGLVWANSSSVSLGSTAWDFTGCLIGTAISVSGGVRLKPYSVLATTLTPGFTDSKMHLVRGTLTELPLDP